MTPGDSGVSPRQERQVKIKLADLVTVHEHRNF